MKKKVKIILLSILVLAGTHCTRDKPGLYLYSTPEAANDGWVVAKAEDAGLNQVVLCDMMDHIINTEDHNIHNILIFKDNKLVFEEYFEGYLYSGDPPGSNGEYVLYMVISWVYCHSFSGSALCTPALPSGILSLNGDGY